MPKIKKPTFRNQRSSPPGHRPIFTLRTKLLLFIGLFLMLVPLVFYINQTIQLMFIVPNVPTPARPVLKEDVAPPPIAISIPAIRLTLPVYQTTITNNTWGIANNGASHLNVSVNPGESGPIILYAHNTKDRFGPIRWLSKGAEIYLATNGAKTHAYRITETVKTTPDEVSVFFRREGETLYLMTCDGFADLKRYIVIAEPIKDASPAASINL